MDLTFEDPTDKYRKRRSYEWAAIFARIKANPGQWLRLAKGGQHSTYTAITRGKSSAFHPDMGVEMTTRNNNLDSKPRTCDLYCRYNPDFDKSLTVKEREKVWVQIRKTEKEKKMKTESEQD